MRAINLTDRHAKEWLLRFHYEAEGRERRSLESEEESSLWCLLHSLTVVTTLLFSSNSRPIGLPPDRTPETSGWPGTIEARSQPQSLRLREWDMRFCICSKGHPGAFLLVLGWPRFLCSLLTCESQRALRVKYKTV